MRTDPFAATASTNVAVPARSPDVVDPNVAGFLRAELADKYVVLIDCLDEGGGILADAKDRIFADMLALEARRRAGGAISTKNTIGVVCAGHDECLTIRYALCDAFSTFDIVTWPDKLTLCNNEFGINDMEVALQAPSSILRTALSAGRDVGVGANVLSYGGRYSGEMVSAGFQVVYPLHGDSAIELRADERAALTEFQTNLLRRRVQNLESDFYLAA